VNRNGTTLREELLAETAVTAHLATDEIARLLDPAGQTGSAGRMVDAVLARAAEAGLDA
jgi:3-carboxy-cis,cis-muconate cycloisomerase